MIIVTVENGKQFKGETYSKVVKEMARSTWFEQNKLQYMEGVAHRCRVWDGSEIKYTTPKEFIYELLRVGVLVDVRLEDH